VAGLSVPHPPFFPDARIGVAPRSAFVYKGQVTDERAYYYARTGLLSPGKYYLKRQWPRPDPWRADPAAYEVRQLNDLGIKGYSAGPSVHVFDTYALADPLLARLPAYPEWSSIGHAARLLPDGYLPSLQARQNRIVNPDLAEYYERLRLVVSGGIFDPARLKEIGRFAFGQNQPLLDAYVQAQAPPGD
jgi:arabinofuranosyltransferase